MYNTMLYNSAPYNAQATPLLPETGITVLLVLDSFLTTGASQTVIPGG